MQIRFIIKMPRAGIRVEFVEKQAGVQVSAGPVCRLLDVKDKGAILARNRP